MDLYDKTKCGYFLNKYGSIKFIPDSLYKYNLFLCLLNNYLIFFSLINFDFNKIYGKTKTEIKEKKNILKYVEKNNLQVYSIKLKKSIIKHKDNFIYYIFKKENTDILFNIFFLNYIIRKDENMYNYFFGNIEKTLTTIFMIKRIQYIKESDKDILIMIFYQEYFGIISNELYEKYGITKDSFPNYKYLYKFLKKNGYVENYFKKYSKYILNSYKIFYSKLLLHKEIDLYKKKEIKKILSLKDKIESQKNKIEK